MNSDRVTSISTGDLRVAGAGNKFLKKKILITAKRGTGKSFVTDVLLRTLEREPRDRLLIVSQTERMNPFYTHKCYPRCTIRYKTDNLSEIITEQRDPATRSSIIVLDDCLATKGLWMQNLEYLLGNDDSDDLTLIVTFQYMPGINPETRALFDYMLLGTEEYVSQRKRLYDLVPHNIPDFGTFQDRMSALRDFHFLMVDVKGRGVPDQSASEEIGFDPRRKTLTDAGFRVGQHTLVINPDDGSNRNVVRDLLDHLAPDLDDVFVVNRYGVNNHGTIVATVHDPTDSTVDDLFHYLFAPENRSKAKLLLLEYSVTKLIKKPDFSEVIFNGRHHNITLVIVERSQPPIPPEMRSNFDRVLVGRYWDRPSLQRVHAHYLGILAEFSQLRALMTHVGGDQLILVDNMVRAGRIHDILSLMTFGGVTLPDSRIQFPGTVPRRPVAGGVAGNDAGNDAGGDTGNDAVNLTQVLQHLRELVVKVETLVRQANPAQ